MPKLICISFKFLHEHFKNQASPIRNHCSCVSQYVVKLIISLVRLMDMAQKLHVLLKSKRNDLFTGYESP